MSIRNDNSEACSQPQALIHSINKRVFQIHTCTDAPMQIGPMQTTDVDDLTTKGDN